MRDPARPLTEIAFTIALQRKDHRDEVTYGELERSLPKDVRKIVEGDWGGYIRAADGKGFAIAFEKAVTKNFPGLYRLVEACEYLFEWSFHRAVSWLLGVAPTGGDEEKYVAAFDFADSLRQKRAVEQSRLDRTAREKLEAAVAARATISPLASNQPRDAGSRCGEIFRLVDYLQHAREAHRNWRDISDREQALHRQQIASRRAALTVPPAPPATGTITAKPQGAPAADPGPEIVPVPRDEWADLSSAERSLMGRCIFCFRTPMPGEFTCYNCNPD